MIENIEYVNRMQQNGIWYDSESTAVAEEPPGIIQFAKKRLFYLDLNVHCITLITEEN